MSRLVLRGISKTFGRRTVLDAIDLDLADGECVALVGPSGCGKSTLLRVIAGLERPDSGSIEIDGTDAADVPTHRRGVGMVFQNDQLFPHLDVADNVDFAMRIRGVDATTRARRVGELLDLVGLRHLSGSRPSELSGGEARRVSLVRSLAVPPRVLLLDEPLTGLDRTLRDGLMSDLRTILDGMARENGTAVLVVTHDPDEASFLADRTLRLPDLGRAES